MTTWKRLPPQSETQTPQHRFLNLASALRQMCNAANRRDVKAEWTEFVSTGGAMRVAPGRLKEIREELKRILGEVEDDLERS